MTLSLYDLTIPLLIHNLEQLNAFLKKGGSHPNAAKLPSASLAPDMKPLTFQVQICSNCAKGVMTRLGGSPAVPMEDNEQTLEELHQRIDKTLEVLKTAKREDYEGTENAIVRLKFFGTERDFTGLDYITRWVMPTFFFHLTTAYNILRNQGVDVGKKDYMGSY